jgi:hypothetical protein
MASQVEEPPEARTKVVYLVSSNRSGSTILTRLLGGFSGFFDAGEIAALWGRGLAGNFLCSCGRPVIDCPFWSRVLTLGFEGGIHPNQVVAWQREVVVLRRIGPFLRLLRQDPRRPSGWPALDGYRAVLSRLYSAVSEAAQARVVVDSSKAPAGAAILALLPNVEPYFVHLVRDPRAVAYSFQRRKRLPTSSGSMEMPRLRSSRAAAEWLLRNAGAEAVTRRYGQGRTLRISYENFVREPEATAKAIGRLTNEDLAGSPFIDRHTVVLDPGHTVGGNPQRFDSGGIVIEPDQEWSRQLSLSARTVVTLVALPGLLRYGYPVLHSHSSE